MKDMTITIDDVRNQIKRTPNWKSSAPDGVNGYWFKNLDTLHVRIVQQLDECLQTVKIPNWMTKSRTCLILKNKAKDNLPSNVRLITCLPITRNTFTGMIGKKHVQTPGRWGTVTT